ncbi:MAG: hypothetical protein EP343_10600 [Deltaproteobacteria bacterium]|nr:MAG: hypothetical protein EP343_10600 [Deltaproteobacteria bacterium]
MTSPFWTKSYRVRTGLALLVVGLVLGSLACAQNRQQGDACFGTYECTPGLFCAGGTCIVPSGQTQCQSNSNCPGSFRCRFSVCVALDTLRACSISQQTQQCGQDQTCVDGFCSLIGEGASCENQQCRIGLVCDARFVPPICRRGKSCESPEDCDEGFVCENNSCVRENSATECNTTDDCDEGEFCNTETFRCEIP